MKKILLITFFFLNFYSYSQDIETLNDGFIKDSITYTKTTNIDTKRKFKEDLKEKYSGKDFIYKEEKKITKREPSPTSNFVSKILLFFFRYIFPFLLAGIVIFIILKAVLGSDTNFWNFKNNRKKVAETLIYEDEDIHEIDLEKLLYKAIADKDYRLAVRYYYLTILKKLSDKKLIDYHKEKTNTEYLFELEHKEMRKHFSYLSYVYSYVWYGEFPIDLQKFKTIENKYKSFTKSII